MEEESGRGEVELKGAVCEARDQERGLWKPGVCALALADRDCAPALGLITQELFLCPP